MLILESSGGRNIFQGDGPVTEPLYQAYLSGRDTDGAIGVGPCQLTWPPLQDEADALGGCWRPDVNCHVGFKLLADHIAAHGETEAFGRYRAGVRWREYPAAVSYVRRAMELLATWRAIVSGHPVSSAPSSEG